MQLLNAVIAETVFLLAICAGAGSNCAEGYVEHLMPAVLTIAQLGQAGMARRARCKADAFNPQRLRAPPGVLRRRRRGLPRPGPPVAPAAQQAVNEHDMRGILPRSHLQSFDPE